MLATAASTWWFSGSTVVPVVGTVAVVVIAGVKAGLVMSHFMELRRAPVAWIVVGSIWLVAATGTILVLYLV